MAYSVCVWSPGQAYPTYKAVLGLVPHDIADFSVITPLENPSAKLHEEGHSYHHVLVCLL